MLNKDNGVSYTSSFEKNLSKYIEFSSWITWYPDLFLDLIKPKYGGITLHSDQRVFLRCATRFFSLYGCFPRGWGKCVSGDTLLFTNEGIKEIGELFDYQNDDLETIIPHSTNVINRDGEIANSNKAIYSGYKPTIILNTEEGYSLEGSLVHPILVMDENGAAEFKTLSNIKIGDYVAINKKNNLWGSNLNIDFSAKLNSWVNSLSHDSLIDLKITEYPKVLTEDIALYLGYLIGGGLFINNNVIRFSNKHQDVLNNYFRIASQIFYCDKLTRYSKRVVLIHDRYFRKYLEFLGLKEAPIYTKEVPGIIMKSPKNIVSTFVRGLFDTCGSVDSGKVSLYTSSGKLAKQLQIILLNYGIISKKIRKEFKNGSFCFSINITGENIYKFSNFIGVSQSFKLADSLYETRMEDNLDGRHYFYSRVKSISYSKNHIYDLYVPKTNSFVSNGIVSHNTYLEVLAMKIACIRYPNIELSLTAQTKENAADLLQDKINEILRHYPMLENELDGKPKFQRGIAVVKYKNNSVIDNLANSQNSKGQRRKRMNIEESALLNNELYEDTLEPIVEVSRYTCGKLSIINPEELNQQINFFTTPGWRGSDEHSRNLQMIQDMINLKGKMVLGSDWMLGCWYGRGSTKSQILQKKKSMSSIAFDQNYGGKWTGTSSNALVNINKLMNCRVLSKAEFEMEDNYSEYYLGVDVARSQNTNNNQSSIIVGKVYRNEKTNKIISIDVVNIINVPNILNFSSQAVIIKKTANKYNAKMTVVDGNGLGVGLVDKLLEESFDPATKKPLGCWDTVNTDNKPESRNASKCLFDLKAQSVQSKVITTFIDMVNSGCLRLLEKRKDTDFTLEEKENFKEGMLPFIQTDLLFEEIGNLKIKHLENRQMTIERVVKKMGKDRFSALAYMLFYINEYENYFQKPEKRDYINAPICVSPIKFT